MKIAFQYPGYERIAAVEVPDANLIGVYAPRAVGDMNEETVLARGVAEPYGAPRLREVLKRGDRVLILIEDGTRGTPIPRVLPFVLDELRAGGVADDATMLLTVQGTHRLMAEDELKRRPHEPAWHPEADVPRFPVVARARHRAVVS